MTMMPLRSMPVLFMFLLCALVAGCAHKKTVLVMPQQPPPSTAPTPVPAAREKPPAPPQPEASPTPEPGQAQNEPQKDHPKPKHPRKPSPQISARNKTVIDNEPVPAPAPPPPSAELAKQMEATEQLLQSTENAIKGITRPLSQSEQALLAQIHDFIKQSRAATDDKDFGRAHNLAVKAHLLSDELAKNK
jgi:outer membrane biosynthesis protein TonB